MTEGAETGHPTAPEEPCPQAYLHRATVRGARGRSASSHRPPDPHSAPSHDPRAFHLHDVEPRLRPWWQLGDGADMDRGEGRLAGCDEQLRELAAALLVRSEPINARRGDLHLAAASNVDLRWEHRGRRAGALGLGHSPRLAHQPDDEPRPLRQPAPVHHHAEERFVRVRIVDSENDGFVHGTTTRFFSVELLELTTRSPTWSVPALSASWSHVAMASMQV